MILLLLLRYEDVAVMPHVELLRYHLHLLLPQVVVATQLALLLSKEL